MFESPWCLEAFIVTPPLFSTRLWRPSSRLRHEAREASESWPLCQVRTIQRNSHEPFLARRYATNMLAHQVMFYGAWSAFKAQICSMSAIVSVMDRPASTTLEVLVAGVHRTEMVCIFCPGFRAQNGRARTIRLKTSEEYYRPAVRVILKLR